MGAGAAVVLVGVIVAQEEGATAVWCAPFGSQVVRRQRDVVELRGGSPTTHSSSRAGNAQTARDHRAYDDDGSPMVTPGAGRVLLPWR